MTWLPPAPPPERKTWEVVAAIGSVISAAAALAALIVSARSLEIANGAQNLAVSQQREQVASRVYLSEAPHYAYTKTPAWWTSETTGEHRAGYVVLNASDVQVNSVWMEGRDGTSIDIWGLQGCSMYALPGGFRPVAIDFRDPYAHWRRPFGGLPVTDGRSMPSRDTGNSPWWADVQSCG